MQRLVLLAVVSLCAVLGGCAELSKVMVVSTNQDFGNRLAVTKSRINDPMVDRYFAELGAMVLASGRRLDRVDDPAFEPDPLLDIYDRFDVNTIHDTAPNAFVSGDDFATVNSALIIQAESAEELVMVLGHEFGHLRHGHMVKTMNRLQVGLVASVVASELAESAAKGTSSERRQAGEEAAATAMAVCMPHTPEAEFESDDTGVAIMVDLGLDLQYADDFFARMLRQYGDASGSHPKPSDRIARIQAHAAEYARLGYTPSRTLDRAAFLAMRDRVRALVKQGVESNTIVYFFDEMKEDAAAHGQQLVSPLGCGPMYADPGIVAAEYYKAAGVR